MIRKTFVSDEGKKIDITIDYQRAVFTICISVNCEYVINQQIYTPLIKREDFVQIEKYDEDELTEIRNKIFDLYKYIQE